VLEKKEFHASPPPSLRVKASSIVFVISDGQQVCCNLAHFTLQTSTKKLRGGMALSCGLSSFDLTFFFFSFHRQNDWRDEETNKQHAIHTARTYTHAIHSTHIHTCHTHSTHTHADRSRDELIARRSTTHNSPCDQANMSTTVFRSSLY
jgi:hypothetical protein